MNPADLDLPPAPSWETCDGLGLPGLLSRRLSPRVSSAQVRCTQSTLLTALAQSAYPGALRLETPLGGGVAVLVEEETVRVGPGTLAFKSGKMVSIPF